MSTCVTIPLDSRWAAQPILDWARIHCTCVSIPYDSRWAALDWAKIHCPSYITNHYHRNPDNSSDVLSIDYFFGSEADATLFSLRWS